jgi:hypothetical protein
VVVVVEPDPRVNVPLKRAIARSIVPIPSEDRVVEGPTRRSAGRPNSR